MKNNWTKFKSRIKSFHYDDEVIHVIPTSNPHGNNEEYFIVVSDDAYHYSTGNTEILTKIEIEEKYKLKLM
jgi:hypothetical protein